MQIKSFRFHDSTSVLPPVIRHAVHPADLHPLFHGARLHWRWRCQNKKGGLLEMADPGFESTSCGRCIYCDSHPPINPGAKR